MLFKIKFSFSIQTYCSLNVNECVLLYTYILLSTPTNIRGKISYLAVSSMEFQYSGSAMRENRSRGILISVRDIFSSTEKL